MINIIFLRRSLFWLALGFILFAFFRDPRLLHICPRTIIIVLIVLGGAMCVVLGVSEIARQVYSDPDCPWYCSFSGLTFFGVVCGLGDYLAFKAVEELRQGIGTIAGIDLYALMLLSLSAELLWLLILEPSPVVDAGPSMPMMPPMAPSSADPGTPSASPTSSSLVSLHPPDEHPKTLKELYLEKCHD